MDPSLIAAGVGLLGSVFGGGASTPKYVKQNYKLQNDLYKLQNQSAREGLNLYRDTDLDALDAQTVASYSQGAMARANQMLQNYDASRAAASGRVNGQDTQLDRGRNQIAADSALKTSDLEAQLSSTRPQRKASLLPQGGAGAGAGFQSAAYLDQSEALRQQQEQGGLYDAAKLIAMLTKRSNGTNDNTPYGNGGASAPWDEKIKAYADQMFGGKV